ncbi:MAG: hypothetical protein C4547_07160 [Phycisphaerales bacterium]|nr:MAG: hypothetical protein C4547_07160 [Phycisphaerales bacterium]
MRRPAASRWGRLGGDLDHNVYRGVKDVLKPVVHVLARFWQRSFPAALANAAAATVPAATVSTGE